MRKAPSAARFRVARSLPVFMPFMFVIGLVALAGSVAAAPMFSGGLGLVRGGDALEAVSASGGSWLGAIPVRMIATQEIGVAFPTASRFAPGVFFNRMRFSDGTGTFELFTLGASFERLFPRLGTAGLRAGIGRAGGNAAGDEWITDLEVFIRVALPVAGVYAAVSRQILIGAFTDTYQSTRVGVTVATPSANR